MKIQSIPTNKPLWTVIKTSLCMAIIFLSNIAFSQTTIEKIIYNDWCCVNVHINLDNVNDEWEINMGDGMVITHNDTGAYNVKNGNIVLAYCYTFKGIYNAVLENLTTGQIVNFTITIEDCEDIDTSPDTCTSFLCWEDLIGWFSCAKTVIIELPDGSTNIISLGNIRMAGGYAALEAQLNQIMSNYGGNYTQTGDPSELGPEADCTKGGTSTSLGFFFNNSTAKILQICGGDCDSSDATSCVDFNIHCD